jgi:hypothetical protein
VLCRPCHPLLVVTFGGHLEVFSVSPAPFTHSPCNDPSPNTSTPLTHHHHTHPAPCPPPQVQNEDLSHEKLQMFNKLWTINFSQDSLLIFSTGRSPNLFCQLWVRPDHTRPCFAAKH